MISTLALIHGEVMAILSRRAVACFVAAVAMTSGGGAFPQRSHDAMDRRLRVHNQTGTVISRLTAAPSGRTGRPGAAAANLAPGQSVAVMVDDGSGACVYDLRAALATGEALERSGVNVCEISDYYYTR